MTKESRLGKYILYEQLGRGGYGTVYRAQDTVLNVERAVKVLHPALASDSEFLGRFRIEAQLAARLEHPHIVPVYDLGEAEGSVFLAMKYMPGGSLKDLLRREGKLPFARALEITRQIADALEYAHTQPEHLVHRDVKPGNILFENDGNARLADFGFAKALLGLGSASLSASGAMIGTPAYMPPEIWLGQAASPATDIYSLACVTYEMLTGESLFGGSETPPPLVMKRHFDPLVLPATWPEGVPEGIAAVLEKALAKDPASRYPDVNGFVTALERLEGEALRQKESAGWPAAEENARREENARQESTAGEKSRHEKRPRQEEKIKTGEDLSRKAGLLSAPGASQQNLPWWKHWGAWLGIAGLALISLAGITVILFLGLWACGKLGLCKPPGNPLPTTRPPPMETQPTATFTFTPSATFTLSPTAAFTFSPTATFTLTPTNTPGASPTVVNNCSANSAMIIGNRTGATATFTLVGPGTFYVTLAPDKNTSIAVCEGCYEVYITGGGCGDAPGTHIGQICDGFNGWLQCG